MAVSLPNGSLVAIASSYGAKKSLTAFTNAKPPVATLEAAHGIIANDVFELTSGWTRVNNAIVRAVSVATNDVTVDGLDTTLTSIYPAGGGVGSIREILGWTQLAQIVNSTTSGGTQQFLTYQFLEGDSQLRIPTVKDPFGIEFTIADDPTLAGFILASAANDDRLPRAVRITFPFGGVIYYNAYISLNKTPTLTVNQLMECNVTLSLLAEPVRYAS